jgi:hypothetical protein
LHGRRSRRYIQREREEVRCAGQTRDSNELEEQPDVRCRHLTDAHQVKRLCRPSCFCISVGSCPWGGEPFGGISFEGRSFMANT